MLRPLDDSYRNMVTRRIDEQWNGTLILSHGFAHDTTRLPGLVWVENDTLLGYLLHDLTPGAWR